MRVELFTWGSVLAFYGAIAVVAYWWWRWFDKMIDLVAGEED